MRLPLMRTNPSPRLSGCSTVLARIGHVRKLQLCIKSRQAGRKSGINNVYSLACFRYKQGVCCYLKVSEFLVKLGEAIELRALKNLHGDSDTHVRLQRTC